MIDRNINIVATVGANKINNIKNGKCMCLLYRTKPVNGNKRFEVLIYEPESETIYKNNNEPYTLHNGRKAVVGVATVKGCVDVPVTDENMQKISKMSNTPLEYIKNRYQYNSKMCVWILESFRLLDTPLCDYGTEKYKCSEWKYV